jgi:DNA-binding XRE family transcriptional regulator
MESSAPRPFKRVFVYARQALAMNQGQLADAMGVSRRTIIRWQRGYTAPVDFQVRQLAALVREEDDDLADELLAAASIAPEPEPQQAGAEAAAAPIASPPALAPAPEAPSAVPAHAIDAIVCVAADAANMVPRAIRPALRAAFARAAELGVSVEAVARGLADAS